MSRTAHRGIDCLSAAVLPLWHAPRDWCALRAVIWAHLPCKLLSQPAMRGRVARTKLTGRAIAALYDRLCVVMPSPVVDLNRAIALGMAFGPEEGLRLVDETAGVAALRTYAPLRAARGDLLFRCGRLAAARAEFEAAARLTRNIREAAFLMARAAACAAA